MTLWSSGMQPLADPVQRNGVLHHLSAVQLKNFISGWAAYLKYGYDHKVKEIETDAVWDTAIRLGWVGGLSAVNLAHGNRWEVLFKRGPSLFLSALLPPSKQVKLCGLFYTRKPWLYQLARQYNNKLGQVAVSCGPAFDCTCRLVLGFVLSRAAVATPTVLSRIGTNWGWQFGSTLKRSMTAAM